MTETQKIVIVRKSVPRDSNDGKFERQYVPREQQENQFTTYYNSGECLRPPYEFNKLYSMVEDSDGLRACIDAMISNVEGFGYDFVYVGKNPEEQHTEKAQQEYITLSDFFDSVNEDESYVKIASKKREDLESLGCAAYEIIRARNKKLFAMYHAPMKDIRIAAFKKDIDVPVPVKTKIRRGGRLVNATFTKYFKRFCQIMPNSPEVKYFKEFGDPRTLDYKTGLFVDKTNHVATELFFITTAFGGDSIYSVPRWSGAIPDVMGKAASAFINYDLMDSQGIPPMAVLISGGVLTQESYDDLQKILKSAKGKENFNRCVVLEAIPEITGLDEKSNVKLDFKNLTEYRKEDQMFGNYQGTALENIRRCFRLAPLYTGDAKSYNLASARSSQLIAEQQIFGPARNLVDDEINRLIVQKEFGIYDWEFRSKGPRITGNEEMANAVEKFSNVGALTINDNIKIANESFGFNMPISTEPYANIPVAILKMQIEKYINSAPDVIDSVDKALNTPQAGTADNLVTDVPENIEETQVQ